MIGTKRLFGRLTGVFSSRKIERASYDAVAFRYIATNTHPDHDTLASFRRRFLKELEGLFVQVLQVAYEMKFFWLGRIALDGTKLRPTPARVRRSPMATPNASKRNGATR